MSQPAPAQQSAPQQVAIGPPDLRNADKQALAVAKYLRNHALLKQRPALFNGDKYDFFRIKRAFRALDDPAYEKARSRNHILPELKTREQKAQLFQKLVVNRFAFNVDKLETQVAISRNQKPQDGIPVVVVSPQQTFGDDDYFMWLYNPTSLRSMVFAAGAIVLAFGIVMFPLWPANLRKLAWYVSLAGIAFVVFMFVLIILRLILYVLTFFIARPGLWLFPNLLEDVGFFESFVPLYAWHGENTLPPKPKKRKRVKTEAEKQAVAAQLAQQQTQQTQLNNPMVQMIMQRAIQHVQKRTAERLQEVVQKEGPKSPAELEALKQKYFQEEMVQAQAELQKLTQSGPGGPGGPAGPAAQGPQPPK